MASWRIFSDFAVNKITADVGLYIMLCALWTYNELCLTNHSAFLNVAILQ